MKYMYLRNNVIFLGLLKVSTTKNGGKTSSCSSFSFGYLRQPKTYFIDPYHLISTLLKIIYDFDISFANDIAIDIA